MGIDLVAPYSFIPVYKGLAGANHLNLIENKIGIENKNERLPVWMRLLMDARTFFEQSHLI